jgi:hypothetical protein
LYNRELVTANKSNKWNISRYFPPLRRYSTTIEILSIDYGKIYKYVVPSSFMSRGLSPIIATMLLIGIAIAVGSILSIWISSQSIEYMNIEGDRRERILDKEGESLALVHVTFSSPNLTLTLQNNGTSDIEVAYVIVSRTDGQEYINQGDFVAGSDIELDYNSSGSITVTPSGITQIEDVRSLEIGSTMGKLFVYNAPSPQILILYTWFEGNNRLVNFSGEGSVDDGRIVEWEWDFDYDGMTFTERGRGAAISYTYLVSGTYDVCLRVTDNTGMVSETVLYGLDLL